MKRRLERFPSQKANSMQDWWRVVPPWRVAWNFALITVARYVPSLSLKNSLYRMTGMKVGKNVSVGVMVVFDFFFPELITLNDNCIIGYNATILAHEFLREEWRKGPVIIGSEVLIGANTTVLAGVEIGTHTVVSAGSLVNRDLPPSVLAGGVPARVIRPIAEEKHDRQS